MSFAIFTDSAANLPRALVEAHEISVIPMSYQLDGEEHTCSYPEDFNPKVFYQVLGSGVKALTSQITPQHYIDKMVPVLKAGRDILFVGLSSGVSGSYNSAEMAAGELRESFPERKICLVDSLGASLGEGLQVLNAAALRATGRAIEDVHEMLLSLRARMCQLFTVDDLNHLRRTGRVSGVTAAVASVLNIKPLLKGNEIGKIVSYDKARGRKRALRTLAEKYDTLVENAAEQTIGISHANCPEDAAELANLIQRNHPPKKIITVDHEPATGIHVGPGMLALYFMGGANVRFK